MIKIKFKYSIGKFIGILYLSIFLIIIIFPILWTISLSFRNVGGLQESYFFIIPKDIALDNYAKAIDWTLNKETLPSLPQMFLNSSIVTFTSVIVTIIIASFAAYSFAKMKFRGKNLIFIMILVGMMIPVQVLLLPIFLLSKFLGILNNYLSLILVYITFGLPISVFILRGFFEQIPLEISEAARIDGASKFRVFFNMYVPISKPAYAACIIFLFLQNWNELIFAIILLMKKDYITIPASLSKLQGGLHLFPVEIYAALLLITATPIIIIFIIFQNWFIKGLTAGAVKG